MPNDTDPNDDLDEDNPGNRMVSLSRNDIRALEAKGKTADENAARATQLERENLFLKAGVDTETELGRVFFKGYDGDLTLDAVKAAAAAINAIPPAPASLVPNAQAQPTQPAQPATTPLLPGEDGFTTQRADLAAGATADTGVDPDPYSRAEEIGRTVMKEGGTEKQAMGTAFNFLANAAQNGDQRVIIPSRSRAAQGGE